MYTDDINAQIVLSLLKKYGIRKIVVSPGTTNVPIARGAQTDSFFEAYSVVDERSAAYFATGLAFESGEPVAISCTGATASRNYLSALTEAYYRNLPIIALTSQHFINDHDDLSPHLTDRTVSPSDVKHISVRLPVVKDNKDKAYCELLVNKALTRAVIKGGGPVHINIPSYLLSFTTPVLPDAKKIDYYSAENLPAQKLSAQLKDKKVAILIGAHTKFTDTQKNAVESFVDAYGAAVFCDHTSSYHGKNKILTAVASDLKMTDNKPEIVIDIGSVTGDYSATRLLSGVECWRISEDGKFRQRRGNDNLKKLFECSEEFFFRALAGAPQAPARGGYYQAVSNEIGKVIIPELPLSNTFISQKMSEKLPKNCSLHLSILNTLRNMDYFELDGSIDASCNVGGFGIDGALSTAIGQSAANKNRQYFAQVGDLAFFYDMNALGIRHITNNLRILLVNNGRGVEFRVNPELESQFGDESDNFIAAGGHYKSAKAWAESEGFTYFSAETKEEFLSTIENFCAPDINRFDKPVLFEVFTKVSDEQEGLRLIRAANRPLGEKVKRTAVDVLKKSLPKSAVNTLKKLKR